LASSNATKREFTKANKLGLFIHTKSLYIKVGNEFAILKEMKN
jgi:hypothetical protein